MSGLLMAAAYSMKPNELGRCGPEGAHRQLFDFVFLGPKEDEAGIREILLRFAVATPFYALIARANNIADWFDRRVVEAYWLGNELLEKVGEKAVAEVIRKDVKREGWNRDQVALLLAGLRLESAKPQHSLSVLYFFTRPGSRMALGAEVKERCDACRVSAGKVTSVFSDKLKVEYQPLAFAENGVITLGSAKEKEIARGFLALAEVNEGDTVSFHLGWGVEKLTDRQTENLRRYTSKTLEALKG